MPPFAASAPLYYPPCPRLDAAMQKFISASLILVFMQLFQCIVAGTTTSGNERVARIFQSETMGEADVRVAIVPRDNADLLVHRVSSRGLARGDAVWYITRDRQEATARVFFVSQGMAQLKICFVDNHGEAGWQVPRPRHIQL